MQGLDVRMRNLVVFPGQVLGSHGRAVRVGWGGSSSGFRKTRGPSGDPQAGGRLGKGAEEEVRACAGVMPIEKKGWSREIQGTKGVVWDLEIDRSEGKKGRRKASSIPLEGGADWRWRILEGGVRGKILSLVGQRVCEGLGVKETQLWVSGDLIGWKTATRNAPEGKKGRWRA